MGVKCTRPGCDREFNNEHGRNVHLYQWHKRRKSPQPSTAKPKAQPAQQPSYLRHCPGCGLELETFARAMALIDRAQRGAR